MARIAQPGNGPVERVLIGASTIGVLIFLLAPVVAVIIMSFTSASTLEFPPPGLSLRWYRETWDMLFGDSADISRLGEAIGTSLVIASLAAGIAAIAGVPAAYALRRLEFRGKSLVEQAVSLPVVFPAIVLGVALLVIVSGLGLDLGVFQIAIAHVIVLLPFMIRNCAAALEGLDPALEEAAKTLGASPMRAFFEVVLPLMRSGIVSGFLLVFILSLNEFTLAYFLFTVDSFPLSMWLFQASSANLNPSIFAVSTLIILLNVLLILAVDRIRGARRVAF